MQTNPHISSFDAPSRADETGFLTVSVPADVLTPVSAYLTLRRHTRGSFLFESVEGGERLARYSFIGIDPETIIESGGGAVTLSRAGDTVRAPGDVFAAIREVLAACPPTTGAQAPPFSGGLVGYIGYDEVRAIERIPYSVPDPTGAPDSMLGMFRTTLVFDHRDHTISIVSVPPAAPGLGSEAQRGRTAERLTELRDLLRNPITSGSSFCAGDSAGDGPSVPSDFDDTASIALEHIRAGDIFQVVLSCRNRVAYEGDPFSVYRTLR
ncbi:MAG TPA: hypothetical protein VJO14_02725, partial [Bacteroidota bacterium]|nr:hypothetical protein [Bacteroidota bacterium]